jgi:glyoxylase-like metal-dependent hydrolase (beta-lactamase superfamily II)
MTDSSDEQLENHFTEARIRGNSDVEHVAEGLHRLRVLFVNHYLCGTADAWVLIDAGLPRSADTIVETAEESFGEGTRPEAILLTHGHVDHVGAFPDLFDRWDVPVYAHPQEMPFLTGERDYPPPDPSVGEGAMALVSPLYPKEGIDLGSRVQALPEDGSVPHLPDWRWLHTEGHISFFRDEDRCLIAGDAFVTVKQESLYKVATQTQEVHGPPAYFTPDWAAAQDSVEALAALNPEGAATGHGKPMHGSRLRDGLETLVADFDRVAVPDQGRYVE